MDPWLETAGVVLVMLSGILAGYLFSRFRKPYWTLGYFLPFLFIAVFLVCRCDDSLVFLPLFFWLVAGRVKFVFLALVVTMGLTTPLSRLPRKRQKVMVCAAMIVIAVRFSLLPFLVPALIKDRLADLTTRIDTNGICFQSTDYTCGPAAAVTALGKLGLIAQEGELAILSHSTPISGTAPQSLCLALRNRYSADGLKCKYRRFESVAQLRDTPLTLAVIKDTLLSDHCVAVLEVSDRTVIVADPVLGRQSMSHEQFEKTWRFSGIVLKRDSVHDI